MSFSLDVEQRTLRVHICTDLAAPSRNKDKLRNAMTSAVDAKWSAPSVKAADLPRPLHFARRTL